MMISELKDDDILDFLMNSELEGDYSPEELKYLLLKWRYFYRNLHGKLGRTKDDSAGEISRLSNDIASLKNQVAQLQMDAVKNEETISSLKNRKLSLKERMSGKITTKDADKGL
jgi:hypothetical protein